MPPYPCRHRHRASALQLYVLVVLSWLPIPAVRADTEAALAPAIQAALAAPDLQHGIAAVVVESQRDGRTLCAIHPDTALIPASNMKIITAALALERLGPDYRFRTLLAMRGKISRGVLEGDLFLKGCGDPTLTTAALHDFIKVLRDRGVQRINGDLLVDDTFFACSRIGRGWAWDYLQEYYAMEISALSLNNNVVALTIKPSTEAGRPALLSWSPPIRYFQVRNETVTSPAGSRETLYYERIPGSNLITVQGEIPIDTQPFELDGITLEDPALYCGSVFQELLEEAGISLAGNLRRGALPGSGAVPLHERLSPRLAEILPLFLKPSNNHMGEQIMQTVLAEQAPHGPRDARSAAGSSSPTIENAVSDFLKQIGADPVGVRVVDGSGLSRLNLVTPRALARVLRYMARQPYANVFARGLPVAGKDGTLSRRLVGTRAAGNIRAKTGTLDAVSCLSGYVTTAGGEPLVFSIMMNNFLNGPLAVRSVQDKLCLLLAGLN